MIIFLDLLHAFWSFKRLSTTATFYKLNHGQAIPHGCRSDTCQCGEAGRGLGVPSSFHQGSGVEVILTAFVISRSMSVHVVPWYRVFHRQHHHSIFQSGVIYTFPQGQCYQPHCPMSQQALTLRSFWPLASWRASLHRAFPPVAAEPRYFPPQFSFLKILLTNYLCL